VTAKQVEARLKASLGRSSKNPLKPLMGAVVDIQAMTESVLEIALRAPRPNFLQLLAQPEMAVIRNNEGTGPYRSEKRPDGSLLLEPAEEDELEAEGAAERAIVLRGEPAALAVARFRKGLAHLVTGGSAGNLPIAQAAGLPGGVLRFDPTAGLFGLVFLHDRGPLADADIRGALSMSIDRAALVAALGVPDLAGRESLLPTGIDELPNPALPDWSAQPLPARRAIAARAVAALPAPVTLRVAVPAAPGYRLVFAHLKRDWRQIGISAEPVASTAEADLGLIDAVAAANLSTWYLRRFSCSANAICSAEADALLDSARNAATARIGTRC
jgi:peptide/nickel transport system substrate-binding protein